MSFFLVVLCVTYPLAFIFLLPNWDPDKQPPSVLALGSLIAAWMVSMVIAGINQLVLMAMYSWGS